MQKTNISPEPSPKAELIKADTALKSFRDGGYHLGDAVGELIDNTIDSGATRIRINWLAEESSSASSKKLRRQIKGFAVADNGNGIPANILANVLTVGFSTRYNCRNTIGRFGVGFKLASISQCRRIEIYTRPAYLVAREEVQSDGSTSWVNETPNEKGKIFKTYMDLAQIERSEQSFYEATEVGEFPADFAKLMDNNKTGTLIVWRDLDRLNNVQSYAETVDEKLADLRFFISRAYRIYIDRGLQIYLNDDAEALTVYDPTFQLDNPLANKLAGDPEGKQRLMKGEYVEADSFTIDGEKVEWAVYLSPPITRLSEGGGGEDGPAGKGQFAKLHIRDNKGKISFLRRGREISYTQVPHLIPGGIEEIDRYIGIEVSFPPALDEYFQVKHIKRGAEPVEKLRQELRKKLSKPILEAKKRVRRLWGETAKNIVSTTEGDVTGGRKRAEELVQNIDSAMPPGRAGQTVSAQDEEAALRIDAANLGIRDRSKQEEFVKQARQKPMVVLNMEWPGKGLLDISHLNRTVVVRINRLHPFIQSVYEPLRSAILNGLNGLDEKAILSLLQKAADGIDLLLFAYAKAENMSHEPEEDYGELREDWGKFAAVYLKRRGEVDIK